MLKGTSPATAATANKSASSTCLKNVNNVASSTTTNAKNVTPVKPTTTTSSAQQCVKSAPARNVVQAVRPDGAPKSSTCSANKSAQTPPCKSANCTKAAVNGESASSAFSIPVPPKSQPPSTAPKAAQISTGCVKTNATASQTTNNNSTNCVNNTTAATTNGNSSIPAPPPKVENTELRIIIIDENWSQYCYRIKINTPFGKLINRFCQQVRKIDHKSVLFWYHGRLVEDDDTPKTLNIKDGEVILAHYIK